MNPMKAVPFLVLALSGCCPSGGGDPPAPAKPKVTEGQLRTARAEVAAAEAQAAFAEAELPVQEAQGRSTVERLQRELALAERKVAQADLDLARQEGEVALEVRRAEDALSDAEDELDQLKKMYQGNTLADQTKEIVLKRGERALARSRIDVQWKAQKLKTLRESGIPLEHDRVAQEAAAKRLEVENETRTAESVLRQKRVALLQAQSALEKARSGLEDLLARQAKP